MQGQDWLGVLVRAGGIVLVVFAGFDVFHLVCKLFDVAVPSTASATADALALAWYLIMGLILILCADRIVAVAYRKRPGADVGNTVRNG